MNNNYIVIVDGLGIGKCDDSRSFKSLNANTLNSLNNTKMLKIRNLKTFGIGNIKNVDCIDFEMFPTGVYGKAFSEIKNKNKCVLTQEFLGIDKSNLDYYNPVGSFSSEFMIFLNEINESLGMETILNKVSSVSNAIKTMNLKSQKNKSPILFSTGKSDLILAANTSYLDKNDVSKYFERLVEYLKKSKYNFAEYRLLLYKDSSVNKDKFVLLKGNRIINQNSYTSDLASFIGNDFSKYLITPSKIYKTQNDAETFSTVTNIQKNETISNSNIFINFNGLYQFLIKGNIPSAVVAINNIDIYIGEIAKRLDETDSILIVSNCGCDFNCLSRTTTRESVPFVYYKNGIQSRNLGKLPLSKVLSEIYN